MKKVTFICPRWSNKGLTSVKLFRMPPLGLISLASRTPEEWEVEIVDENKDTIDYDENTDLVALTAMTSLAPRAHQIAQEYRRRGVPVIMGGIHASMLPDEALEYVDSVVIGEADEIWGKILSDFSSGKLKREYRAKERPILGLLPKPKRRVSRNAYYPFFKVPLIQTSRGCPIGCDFCSVSSFNGRKVRNRSVKDVIEEVKNFTTGRSLFNRHLFFADDNIVADVNYAEKLFQALIPLKVKWLSQCDIRIAFNEDLLKLAVDSGLCTVFVGLESVDEQTLGAEVSRAKAGWRGSYEEALQRLTRAGVIVEGAFVFGLDSHNKSVFQRTVEWAVENNVSVAQFTVATPFPGTKLFERMENQGRIVAKLPDGRYDWEKFNAFEVCIKPTHMSEQDLQEGVIWAYKTFYRYSQIFKRLRRALKKVSMFEKVLTYLINNDFHYSFRV